MIRATRELIRWVRRYGQVLTWLLMLLLTQSILTACNLPVNGTAGMTDPVFSLTRTVLSGESSTTAPQPEISSSPKVIPVAAGAQITTAATLSQASGVSTATHETSGPESSPTGDTGQPCNLAVAGSPIDVSITDGTVMMPGQTFSKTWRLVNAGACDWTQDYALVWFSGPNLALTERQYFRRVVRPGEIIEITVDMAAPAEAGSYQSNWKIQDQNGVMFGLGPNGDSPFWVKIKVYVPPTDTVEVPTLESSPTPALYASGSADLALESKLDLDHGAKNPPDGADFKFTRDSQGRRIFAPEAGSWIALFRGGIPGLDACGKVSAAVDPVLLEDVHDDEYYCYRTGQGLPGYLSFSTKNLTKNTLALTYWTWDVP